MAHTQSPQSQNVSAPVFEATTSTMQVPTLSNVRIRSTHEAHQIFYAVYCNELQKIMRHLDEREREVIASGHVYVWEERDVSQPPCIGIGRWLDGMRWSRPFIRDEFSFYNRIEAVSDSPVNYFETFTKQTYSVFVASSEGDNNRLLRKWHLTAYFTKPTADTLSSVHEVLQERHLSVPEGLFRNARVAPKARRLSGVNRQQPQRRIVFYGADASMPSGSLSASAYPPSAPPSTFDPHTASCAPMAPHGFPYPRPQLHYSAYVQDDRDTHCSPLMMPPPTGGSYAVPVLPPPPSPEGESSINLQGRRHEISYPRPPRESYHGKGKWVGDLEERPYHERDRMSPRRIPTVLPNTYDPTRGTISGPSLLSHSRSSSRSYTNVAGPSTIQSYSRSRGFELVDVSAPWQAQSGQSPASSIAFARGKADYAETEVADADVEMELDDQRQPSVGPVRVPATPSSYYRNFHLSSVRRDTSPQSLHRSVSEANPIQNPASAFEPSSSQASSKRSTIFRLLNSD